MTLSDLITTRANRRRVVAAAAASTVTVRLGRATGAQASSTFGSGGLGLTRAEFEERFGPGEQVEMAGHAIYDASYAYGTQLGTIYAWYYDFGQEASVAFIEIVFTSQSLSASEALDRAEHLMPADAHFTELYVAPVTPSGPVAIEMLRFVSESLGTIHRGVFASEFLVMIQQPWSDGSQSAATASAISIMTRMMTSGR